MYGCPASGKTTYARKLADGKYFYLAADEIRRELYGSQDVFGNPGEIYDVLLARMMELLRNGQDVIYDACNLYKRFRLDYLVPIQNAGIPCRKRIIRLNTRKDTCLLNHARRGRDFDIRDVMHYFDLMEYPELSEGWDDISDVPDHAVQALRLYIAASMDMPDGQLRMLRDVTEYIRKSGHSAVLPYEHTAFLRDPAGYERTAIRESDAVVLLPGTDHAGMDSMGTGRSKAWTGIPAIKSKGELDTLLSAGKDRRHD